MRKTIETGQSIELQCPACGEYFAVGKLEGRYLQRTCPHCHGPISSAIFDKEASSLCLEMRGLRLSTKDDEIELERINQRLKDTAKWWWRLLRRYLLWKRKRLLARVMPVRQRLGAIQRELSTLAKASYYSSEWYLRTHLPLTSAEAPPYTLQLSYDEDGVFRLTGSGPGASGVIAEWCAFKALLQKVTNEGSSLRGAQLLPNLYVPLRGRSGKRSDAFSQVDCLVLTRQAAFVLEVKRRRSHIVSYAPFSDVFSTNDGELVARADECLPSMAAAYLPSLGFSDDLSSALEQNARHASALASSLDTYGDRVYEQLVIVDALSLTTDSELFTNCRNVSILGKTCDSFVETLEKQCQELDEILSQEKLDRLGTRLLTAFGDLNQKHHKQHVERIRQSRKSHGHRTHREGRHRQ